MKNVNKLAIFVSFVLILGTVVMVLILLRENSRTKWGRSETVVPSYVKNGISADAGKVVIRKPIASPKVYSGVVDFEGNETQVACSTCHSTKDVNYDISSSDELDEFHQGLAYQHGGQTCMSCHNSEDYDSLRLADGRSIDYTNVMQLCSQCHGPQARDYKNGSHGGMTGYWDLKAGSRVRNTCTDCHDVHSPAYPQVMPVFQPRDRGVRLFSHGHDEHVTETNDHE